MNLLEAVRIAMRALRANRLRSALTMLGIIIGVAAVILLVAIGNGVSASFSKNIQPLANLITIVRVTGNIPGGGAPRDLLDADVLTLEKQLTHAATVTPTTTGQALAETEDVKFRATAVGSTENWLMVNNRKILVGSFFDETQAHSAARVVVLGPTVAHSVFGSPEAALGQALRVNRQAFKVIGVMKPVGQPDDSNVVMPLDTARRLIFGGSHKVTQIIVQATEASAVPAAMDEVTRILDDRHRIRNPVKRDYEVQSLRSLLDSYEQTLRILTLFIAAVAAISLVVGGIGVLNIMLVSVTERTREIGIRKAIGATRRAILQQFLTEALVLAGLGGLIGVIIGTSLSLLGGTLAPSFDPTLTLSLAVSIPSVVISFMVSLMIGLTAGGYPAYRAARLRPIEALRYQ